MLTESIDLLYDALRIAVTTNGPYALICKRPMCPGIPDVGAYISLCCPLPLLPPPSF